MNKNLKKTLLAALAGAFVITGFAAYNMPGHSAAAPQQMRQAGDRMPGDMNKRFDASQFAQQLADDFNVDKSAVEKALEDGWRPNDLQRASFISYAADKSLNDVLKAKTTTNTWRDVSENYGITQEKHFQVMQQLHSSQIAKVTGVDAAKLQALFSDGYHTRDIAMAAGIANKSGKSIDDVLSMKKLNNNWFDIAESLSVDKDELIDMMSQCRRGGFGPGMEMRGGPNFDNTSRHGGWHHRGDRRGNYNNDDCYGGGYCGGGYNRG